MNAPADSPAIRSRPAAAPLPLGRPPSRVLDLMPVRLGREVFRFFPGEFTGIGEAGVLQGALRRMRQIAREIPDTPIGCACESLTAGRRLRVDASHVWPSRLLGIVAESLEAHPPGRGDPAVRAAALSLLDFPLHVRAGTEWRKHTGRFFHRFCDEAIEQIRRPVPPGRLRVWKLYNLGFVAKTAEAAVAFDVHPGKKLSPPLSGRQLRALAESIDLATVSHVHRDHMHAGFLRRVLSAGRPVVVPRVPPGLAGLAGVHRCAQLVDSPLRVGALEVRALPGWQRFFVRNYVHVVRIGPFRVVHTGDNTRMEIYEQVRDDHGGTDVALVNCWAGYAPLVRRVRPRLVVPGHENELGHMVSMRWEYARSLRELQRLGLPCWRADQPDDGSTRSAVLSWGESLSLPQSS
jgi:L-ascorbate metabolism protein UlaG (beta-lactamase superfamily)